LTVILVRHGQSEGNAAGVFQGWSEYPLNETGRGEAAAAAERLVDSGAVAVYSSNLGRARETAEIIAAKVGLPVEERDGLHERGFGEGEGLSWDEMEAKWGPDLRFGEDRIPGEEPLSDFCERTTRAFEQIFEQHTNEIAICVTHGGVLNMLVTHLLGVPLGGENARVRFSNCSLTVVELDRERRVLSSINDSCHTDGIAG
jgi:broad specificity phosphatase PhoE